MVIHQDEDDRNVVQIFTSISLESRPTEKSRELALVGTGITVSHIIIAIEHYQVSGIGAQKFHIFIFNQ